MIAVPALADLALLGAVVPAAASVRPDLLRLGEIFLLLFVTLGPPLKTPAAYLQLTKHLTAADARSLAVRTFVLALVAALAGGFLGKLLANNWHVPPATLMLTGGLIFLLVSLQSLLSQFNHAAVGDAAAPAAPLTAFQVAIPMIVTPYGLAAVIVLLGNSTTGSRTLVIVGLLVLVMVLHLLAMVFARPIMRTIGPIPLQLFGVVVGVLTVGLSLQIMLRALRQMGLIAGVVP
ncbi:MarC family protein [Novilysobacter selenitireducens]|uniref:UPF0056 membrane protein n=1 Tax=Novilysobacter selenitireducens TaxID=2872639 RepID=A0ABS7T5G7_9GAMM|nr:MarC family protein [Lysobacter selenitireducens]MBZ4039117.1 hypothetical protein [Lysobacter selenitireducens]